MMRRLLTIALLLAGSSAWAQNDFIRFRGTAGLSSSGAVITSTLPISGTTGFFTGPVSIGNTYASPYANLYGDAANTLALRNSTNAQTFNVYNTYTDGSNYERASLVWTANDFVITTAGTGTGSATRNIRLAPGGTLFLGGGAPYGDDVYGFGGAAYRWTNVFIARSIQGSKSKALTDAAAAASVVRIAVATNSYIGGKIIWTATSTDGTDQLVTSGEQFFSGADKAGTVTCGTGSAIGTATAYTTANTLVCTVTVATSTTNCDIQASCTNDKAGTQAIAFNYRLDMPLTATVTPQ